MSTLTTRAGKGSPLTSTEVDTNFTNLNTDKIQATNSPGTNGQVLTSNGTTASWTTPGGGGPSIALLTVTGTAATVTGNTRRTNFSETSDVNGIVSLTDTNYRFILGAGTYVVQFPGRTYTLGENYPSTSHTLYNITNSSDLVSDFVSTNGSNTTGYHFFPNIGYFTLAGSTTIEYRADCGVLSYARFVQRILITKLA